MKQEFQHCIIIIIITLYGITLCQTVNFDKEFRVCAKFRG